MAIIGWYVIMEPSAVEETDSPIGIMCKDVFGDGWDQFRIAHMSTVDRAGIEWFEFPNKQPPENNVE